MNSVTETSELLTRIKQTRLAALLVCLSTTSACLTPEIPADASVAGETAAVASVARNNAANAAPVDKICISVSDGEASRSLPEFSITVSQVGLGSMSLSWTAPTENVDGSALTDLAGYKLYYGKSAGRYDKSIRIDNPTVTSYLIDDLLPDTYYVVATSFNATGIESAFSNEAVKTVTSN